MQLSSKGIEITRVTLHVGLGTFAPLRVERVSEVSLHRERYTIGAAAADAIHRAVAERRRIVAVGTTVVRTLEAAALAAGNNPIQPHSGETDIFISPGFDFRVVGALLTNFHLPQSSLLMLVWPSPAPSEGSCPRPRRLSPRCSIPLPILQLRRLHVHRVISTHRNFDRLTTDH